MLTSQNFNEQIGMSITAAPYVDTNGKTIVAGKEKTRFRLLDGDDRFCVAIQTISTEQFDLLFSLLILVKKITGQVIEIKDKDNNRLLINVNSVAARLHLTYWELLKISFKENSLDKLRQRAKTISLMMKIKEYHPDKIDRDHHDNLLQKTSCM